MRNTLLGASIRKALKEQSVPATLFFNAYEQRPSGMSFVGQSLLDGARPLTEVDIDILISLMPALERQFWLELQQS